MPAVTINAPAALKRWTGLCGQSDMLANSSRQPSPSARRFVKCGAEAPLSRRATDVARKKAGLTSRTPHATRTPHEASRDEVAGAEGVEGEEAGGELVVGEARGAEEFAQKFRGGTIALAGIAVETAGNDIAK